MSESNPLFFATNAHIAFEQISAEDLHQATQIRLEQAQKQLSEIYESVDNEALIQKYDDFLNPLRILYNLAHLLSSVSPNEKTQEAAVANVEKLEAFMNGLSFDEKLFEIFTVFSEKFSQKIPANHQKLLADILKEFNKNGLHLSKEAREELKALKDQMAKLHIRFAQNIAKHQDFLILDEQDLEGLSQNYKNARRTEDGKYKIGLDYPSYIPFMQLAASETARKALYEKYLRVAYPENLTILEELINLRKDFAQKVGFKSYAAYVQSSMMAQNPENVWELENDLADRVRPKAQKDYAELLALKNKYLPSEKLNAWESAYYQNLLMKEKYQVDSELVKEYFELGQVVEGVFQICKILYDIDFVLIKDIKLWHESVQVFEIKEKDKLIGRFYLDMFPRSNKYNHAACFPLISGKKLGNDCQIPVLALVCNFPSPSAEQPSLLSHRDVETYFHEFGHALHGILGNTDLGLQYGFSTTTDFVEVPSQHFENWAWHYDSLKLFAKHYQTGEILPKALFEKMLAAKKVASGLFYQRQILFGSFDMYLNDKFQESENIMEIYKKLHQQHSLYEYVEDTYFPASFGHLTDYGALYYSYLWSLVYAEDIFSVFEEKGVLNPEIGQKYKKEILSKGSSVPEMQQLEAFLGRKAQKEAFLKNLGV